MLYSRQPNETWHPAEELIAEFEGSPPPVLLHSSGMAAMANAMHLNRPGAPIVMPRHACHASLIVARDHSACEGDQVRKVDAADTDAVVTAISADDEATGLVWIESPTNPMLGVADVPTICEAAHAAGALVAVNNTFAIPLGQRPLEAGADVVVHSATRYLSGHSDVVLGAVLASRGDLHETLHEECINAGEVADPIGAWLLLRSMHTLPLRMERIWTSTAELACRLEEYPLVAKVRHPSLPSHPQHERAERLMPCFGDVLTMRPVSRLRVAEELGCFVWI